MSCEDSTFSEVKQPVFSVNKNIETVALKPTTNVSKMVVIKAGTYTPLYGNKNKKVEVSSFLMDAYPVTNQQYLEFLKQNPIWRKSIVSRIFADENYLRSWKNDTAFGANMQPNAPVTNVSWFAAKAYCESNGKRLATVDEWEYVARADEEDMDASQKVSFNKYIIGWLEKSSTYNNAIGSTYKNYWGVYDLQGLVWEWTDDFNAILVGKESRNMNNEDKNLFCGSGSLNATDLMNYAAFMRYAFRSSMKADYAVLNLGFRCAKNISNE